MRWWISTQKRAAETARLPPGAFRSRASSCRDPALRGAREPARAARASQSAAPLSSVLALGRRPQPGSASLPAPRSRRLTSAALQCCSKPGGRPLCCFPAAVAAAVAAVAQVTAVVEAVVQAAATAAAATAAATAAGAGCRCCGCHGGHRALNWLLWPVALLAEEPAHS
eukprot:364358-Chlamydomonas_euryale.AAC.6